MKLSRFSMKAANRNTVTLARVNPITKPLDTRPWGKARAWVRGFRESMGASTSRLKAMAALRAPTMASRIQPHTGRGGKPR